MKFSSQEEYGLRCLLQIARVGEKGSLTIPEISRLEDLTTTHVAKLLMILRRGGFVLSTRGQSGGYTIARPATELHVGEVLAVLGGRLYDDGFCTRHGGPSGTCAHDVDCSIRSVWEIVQHVVDDVLQNLTVADLISEAFHAPARPLVPLQMAGKP